MKFTINFFEETFHKHLMCCCGNGNLGGLEIESMEWNSGMEHWECSTEMIMHESLYYIIII